MKVMLAVREHAHLHSEQIRPGNEDTSAEEQTIEFERCQPNLLRDDGHDQLVAQGRQQKGQERRRDPGQAVRRYRRSVDVSQQKGLPRVMRVSGNEAIQLSSNGLTCTGLFHFRANSSHVVEFHQSW